MIYPALGLGEVLRSSFIESEFPVAGPLERRILIWYWIRCLNF